MVASYDNYVITQQELIKLTGTNKQLYVSYAVQGFEKGKLKSVSNFQF